MNDLAPWLVLCTVGLPLIGVLTAALLLLANGRSGRENGNTTASACVQFTMFAACCSALLLIALLSGAFGARLEMALWRVGTVLELEGPRPLRMEWAFRMDLFSAAWIAALNGLSGLVLVAARRGIRIGASITVASWRMLPASEPTLAASATTVISAPVLSVKPRAALAVTVGLLNSAATMLVMSNSLVQLLVCWGAVSLATWQLVGWTSRETDGSSAIRRAITTGFCADGMLVLAVLLMGITCQTFVIDRIVSAEGLAALGEHNPALPGFIGCLLVLSVLGRSGLFPCFGWHAGASTWDRPVWAMIYLVGYVPAAVWLLLRFQPLIASADAPLALLGGLSTLAAVLGAFVACGQAHPRSASAFLVTSQIGVAYAALAGGLFDAESWRAWSLGATEAAPLANDVGRVVLGQVAVFIGTAFVWRRSRSTAAYFARDAWYQSLVQLSQRRLYVDEVMEFLFTTPLQTWMTLARHGERLLTDSLYPAFTVRLPGWFAQQLESLQIGRVEFDLAASLLSVAAVLLTLLLVT